MLLTWHLFHKSCSMRYIAYLGIPGAQTVEHETGNTNSMVSMRGEHIKYL